MATQDVLQSTLRKFTFTLKFSVHRRLGVFQRVRWVLSVIRVFKGVTAAVTGFLSAPTKKISCHCKCTLLTFHRWNECGFDQGPRRSMQHQGTVCKGGKWPCWYWVPWRPAVNAALIHWYMFYATLKNTWLKQPKQACYMLMLQSNV